MAWANKNPTKALKAMSNAEGIREKMTKKYPKLFAYVGKAVTAYQGAPSGHQE